MTTFAVPPTGAPAWREIYPTPPNVQTGRWCPIDDTTLTVRLDGWSCPACQAAWNFEGLAGRWLETTVEAEQAAARLRRIDRWAAVTVGASATIGLGFSTGRAMRPHADLVPDEVIWWAAGLLAVAAVGVFAVALLLRWCDARRYAGNEIVGPAELTAAEVPDER